MTEVGVELDPAGFPDTAEEFEAKAVTAGGPVDEVYLTLNLVAGTNVVTVGDPNRPGSKIVKSHQAMFWHTTTEQQRKDLDGKPAKDADGSAIFDTVESYQLWAQFQILAVKRTRVWDPAEAQWAYGYEVKTDGVSGKRTVSCTPEDFGDIRAFKKAFASCGSVNLIEAKNNRTGDPLTQLRTLLEVSEWGAFRTVTSALGRVKGKVLGLEHDVFVFPEVTIGPAGPTDSIMFEPRTPNAAAEHTLVKWDPSADVEGIAVEWIEAAAEADPSAGLYVLGTVLGWCAATCFASEVMGHALTGMSPLLYVDAAPGSGKSTLIPRIAAPFGVHPSKVSADFSTPAQVRDKFSALCDAPFVVDEVNIARMKDGVGKQLTYTMKDSTNGRDRTIGGAGGTGAFRQRTVRTNPSMIIMGERLPEEDQAVMDRLASVSMRRREYLSADQQERSKVGFQKLHPIAADPAMPALAGEWYAWVLRNSIAEALSKVSRTSVPGLENVSERNRATVFTVLAGLEMYGRFLDEVAPAARPGFDLVAQRYRSQGIGSLLTRMDSLQGASGAIAMLHSLAMLTKTRQVDRGRPIPGVHYSIVDENGRKVLKINAKFMCSLLKENAHSFEHAVQSERAFVDEVSSWTTFAAKDPKRRRPAGSGRSVAPVAWWDIDLEGLEAAGGPGYDDFNQNVF